MSNDNTQDDAEPSLASSGSHRDGMVARLRSWRDERGYPTPGEMMDEAADEIERLRLTDEERAFFVLHMERLVWWGHSCPVSRKELETVRGLFERLS